MHVSDWQYLLGLMQSVTLIFVSKNVNPLLMSNLKPTQFTKLAVVVKCRNDTFHSAQFLMCQPPLWHNFLFYKKTKKLYLYIRPQVE